MTLLAIYGNIMNYSIVISSFKRLNYLKRTLYSIVNNIQNTNNELIIAEEISEETPAILKELETYKTHINYTCVLCDLNEFTKATGLTKFFNNSSWTNNVGLKHAQNELIFQQGNEVIGLYGVYEQMAREYKDSKNLHTIIYSTTANMMAETQSKIGEYGEKLTLAHIRECTEVLQAPFHPTLVTNYICLYPLESIELLRYYDERMMSGAAAEDSCVSRRFMQLPNAKRLFSSSLSIHQDHMGITAQRPFSPNIPPEKWKEGTAKNIALYNSWDGTSYENKQPWEPGVYGVKDIIKNTI